MALAVANQAKPVASLMVNASCLRTRLDTPVHSYSPGISGRSLDARNIYPLSLCICSHANVWPSKMIKMPTDQMCGMRKSNQPLINCFSGDCFDPLRPVADVLCLNINRFG